MSKIKPEVDDSKLIIEYPEIDPADESPEEKKESEIDSTEAKFKTNIPGLSVTSVRRALRRWGFKWGSL